MKFRIFWYISGPCGINRNKKVILWALFYYKSKKCYIHVLKRLVHLQEGGGKVLVPPPCLQCVDLVESGGEHGDGDHHGDGEEAHDEGHRLLPTIDATTSCLVVHLHIIQRRHFYNL